MIEGWTDGAAGPVRRPAKVFLSFAGDDRPAALRLRQDLRPAGIEALVDTESFPPGGNVPLDISQALSRSDYYLLFWSRHAVDRPWVSAEWSAAFTMDLRRRGGFLFVARLDATALPPLLVPRRYLDATGDWDAFVRELIGIWKRDKFLPEPVLPAPAVTSDVGAQVVEIYVRNRALAVSHLILVPDVVTGAALWGLVRESLRLKEGVSRFMGEASLSFRYELSTGGQQIPDDEGVRMHVADGAQVDLAVQVEVHTCHETVTTMRWRHSTSTRAAVPGPGPAPGPGSAPADGGELGQEHTPGRDRGTPADQGAFRTAGTDTGMDPRLIRALLDDAFSHLRPG